MNIIVPGHRYYPQSFDGATNEIISFMQRTGDKYPGNKFEHPGTNCQELIRILIDRVKYLQHQVTCDENTAILQHLRMALLLFEQRAAERHGLNMPVISLHQIETEAICDICGHIICTQHKSQELP